VAYYRGEGGGERNDVIVDAWLLKQFPGRTLEELDGMNYVRYLRAMEVRHIEQVEQMRTSYLKGEVPNDKQDSDVWSAIREHDDLLDM
jgi:hypothetical protein